MRSFLSRAVGAVSLIPVFGVAAQPTALAAAPGTPGRSVPETIRLETPTGAIVGTLELPASSSPLPVALIIAGSGPTDRDGNTVGLPGANNSLRLLAEGLAAHGIASVRYDKRGVGESRLAGPREADLRFDGYVEDAAAWVRRLRADARFTTVTVIGHSEGSLIGMLAAERAGGDAMVSIAGIGRRADQVLRVQLAPRLPSGLLRESDRIMASLVAGHGADSVPAALAPLFRSSVQPYLISWFRHDPAAVVARLAMPVLVAQGTTDIQVGPSEAQLLVRAQPKATLLVIDGMNHVLKRVPADQAAQIASYGDPRVPVAPELTDGIARFVRALARAAPARPLAPGAAPAPSRAPAAGRA